MPLVVGTSSMSPLADKRSSARDSRNGSEKKEIPAVALIAAPASQPRLVSFW